MSTGRRSTTSYKLSHHTTGPYLPLPGGSPDWPFNAVGNWGIDVNAAAHDWLQGLREWRNEHLVRLGYDDRNYRRPELAWAQRNFVHAQMMIEDRSFYDPLTGRYTVARYLDDLQRRFGGIDSVLLWYVYPNIGVDDRNQFDLIHDLPGGLQGLRSAVDDFHDRGVRVFLPTMPWDQGTRPNLKPDWEMIAELVVALDVDGINGDTYGGVPKAFFDACERRGRPLVLQPESTVHAGDHILPWNVQSWLKLVPEDVIPAVLKYKWLEPRHITQIENRWSRNRTNDLQVAFFNGSGYVAWENIWGFWNEFTPRDAAALRRIASIQRQFATFIVSGEWTPYEQTLQRGVFASRFPAGGSALWCVLNRNEYDVEGDQLDVAHVSGTSYFDVWSGERVTPAIEADHAVLATRLEGHGFGAFFACDAAGSQDPALEGFLAQMRTLAQASLRSSSAQWRSLPQQLVPIACTTRHASALPAMVEIPAAEFDFVVHGVEIEGEIAEGMDVQYPWEPSARRGHRHRLRITRFFIDRWPVTNEQFAAFVADAQYRPADPHNFLKHWHAGAPQPGSERQPVRWVALEDARAYAAWAGKRLPHEWEWQYAAQGGDGRRYPWGNDWRPEAVPDPCLAREMSAPADVDAHPLGASPFGVMDLVGNVWQWTDEYSDERTRAAILRGGNLYQPQTSHWYFPQAYRLDQHGKYLLMAPCKDRSGGIGFRCAADASES